MHRRKATALPTSQILTIVVQQILISFVLLLPLVSAFTLQMGLLKVGTPQPWPKSKKNLNYVREAGVRQFISTYNRVKDFQGDELMWGDEVEYGIFILEDEGGVKKVKLSLRAKEIMDTLNQNEQFLSRESEGCNWVPEYGAWMVEATPSRPYTGYVNDLLRVERNMRLRRKRILAQLKDNEIAPTVSVFPLLGVLGGEGSVPPVPVGGPITESEYIGDGIINPHPRFGALSANIRQRRGEKVNIRVPLFHDTNTPEFVNHTSSNPGSCCGSDSMLLWRYGKGDVSREKYGNGFVIVGCSNMASGDFTDLDDPVTLEKWLVNVDCKGCKGLFYRSSPPHDGFPAVIVPDADWPRNGEVVVGAEIPDVPGWIRLQNGYYLPMYSDDGEITFLQKAPSETHATNQQQVELGSETPQFRQSLDADSMQKLILKQALENAVNTTLGCHDSVISKPNLRPAIHMDAMAFGMGCCCLQITFQGTDVDESRFLYDQLAVMAPIMMALTASTPVLKGRLADTDCRWGIISECVDDRTLAERGREDDTGPDPEVAGKGRRRLYKSRYDSISTYLYQGHTAEDSHMKNRIINTYNDIPVPIDEEKYQDLREAGIDPLLSQHIAHIFVRDPLVIFDGAVEEVNDETQTEHFESIQSTNWQSVRWKPPPPRNGPNDPHIGWRTEFRSMEIQLTDFENAAFTTFITLLTRVILTFDLNLYIPLSRVDANMQRAHGRDAARKGKFFFRRHMAPLEEGDDGFGEQYTSMFSRAGKSNGLPTIQSETSFHRLDTSTSSGSGEANEEAVSSKRRMAPTASGGAEENSYEEMTMAEIMMGKKDYFPGLIPLIYAYLDHIQCDSVTLERMTKYLDFIEKRATGELLTPASWIRKFVRNHEDYKFDSVISDAIAYDLLVACQEIGEGKRTAPELLGENIIKPILASDAYQRRLDSKRVNNSQILSLLERYSARKAFAQPH